MRTVTQTINVYQFAELCEKAKESVISRYADTDVWDDEYEGVLEDFQDRFNVSVTRWEVGAWSPISYRFYIYNMENEELCGLRLRTWIINNFWSNLYCGKYYSSPFRQVPKSAEHPAGLAHSHRYSKVIMEPRCLTGFCAGNDILKPIFKYLESGWKDEPKKTWEGIVDECIRAFFDSWRDDKQYLSSEEYVNEVCDDNGWEFTDDGRLYY